MIELILSVIIFIIIIIFAPRRRNIVPRQSTVYESETRERDIIIPSQELDIGATDIDVVAPSISVADDLPIDTVAPAAPRKVHFNPRVEVRELNINDGEIVGQYRKYL